ncbi:MAG: 50S ribosomal protein L25 [Deltaproteobacteria bacterium]|nr:50S ribosomal protein L25 [Deltaproteobacteria bacterium]
MEVGKLEVHLRQESGKGYAHKLRQAGRIPAVCYGGGEEPIALALDPRALKDALDPEKRQNTVITMTVKGGDADRQLTVMLKDYQTDPLRNTVLHADFVRVDLSREIHVTVPLLLTGKAEGVKIGGILHQVFRMVDVACLPDRIPTKLEADVSALNIGDALKASDVKVTTGVRVLLDPKQSVAVVVAPKEEKVEEAAAVEGAVEGAAGQVAAPAEGAKPGEAAAPGKPGEAKAEGKPESKEDKRAAAKMAARVQAKADKVGGGES